MKVILISGKAEAGKTTTANFLKKKLEENAKIVHIIPYGQYVKDTAKMLFNWDGKKDEAGRTLLQCWGTDLVRTIDPEFWVETVQRLAFILSQTATDYIIVDDCRFPNEIENWLNDWQPWDVTTVRIERTGYQNSLTLEQRQHPSECALDGYNFDITIDAYDKEELEYAICEQLLPKIDGLD